MWLRQAGVSAAKVKQAIWVDSFESALQLAEKRRRAWRSGWRRCSPSASGSALSCRPIPMSHATGGYWLVHRPQETEIRALRVFKRWLRMSFRRTFERDSSLSGAVSFVARPGSVCFRDENGNG
jgi:LysR family glycine cleavage system transcriptional activator